MARLIPAQVYKGLVALVMFLILAIAACGASNATPAPGANTRIYPTVDMHFDTFRYEFNTPQSMCSSILTSDVIVGSHGQPHWNTSNGQRPAIADSKAITDAGYRIYTPVLFAKNQTLIDHRPAPTREFVTLGGKAGSDSMYFDPFPQLRDGEQYVIVFGPGSLPAGQGKATDWLVVYDAFPVDGQGTVLLQAAGSPNEPGSGKPQPEIKLSLTDLKQQLAACK